MDVEPEEKTEKPASKKPVEKAAEKKKVTAKKPVVKEAATKKAATKKSTTTKKKTTARAEKKQVSCRVHLRCHRDSLDLVVDYCQGGSGQDQESTCQEGR